MRPNPLERLAAGPLPGFAPGVERGGANTLDERLARLHAHVREDFPFVARMAVALHDARTGEIKTFIQSPVEGAFLTHYSIPLAKAGWLDSLRSTRSARVVDPMNAETLGIQEHSLRVLAAGYRASYTVPVFEHDRLVAFIFFNADRNGVFTDAVTRRLAVFVEFAGLIVSEALRSISTLMGSLNLLRDITRFRDDETSNHLDRMPCYAELIARKLAPGHDLRDEWLEYVHLFAPLHDIGKVAIPDAVLFKPGRLAASEFEIMKQHAVKGEEILSTLLRQLGLSAVPHIGSLLEIARHHHERWDGSGYPDGLRGEAIPLEARIVKVADVFDALTTRRCYKEPWRADDAFDYLAKGSGSEFDAGCVEAFLGNRAQVHLIQQRFRDEGQCGQAVPENVA